MKKGIILAVIAIFTTCIANSSAQTTSFGLKLNVGATNLKLSDAPGSSSTFKPSASFGGFTRIEFSEHFALQPELMFNYTESEIKFAGEKTKFKYAGIEIPVYGLGQVNIGNGKLTVGAGPHIGYGFSADSNVENLSEEVSAWDVIEMDHWYAGGGVTAGYEFKNRISVNATYQLSYDLRSGNSYSQIRTQNISVGVGYRF